MAIAIPSFRLLFAQYDFPKADLTITATGSQWYWTYEYPDHGITFDSIMVQDADLKEGQPRLLTVDREVVVPVGKNVHGAGQGERRDPRLGRAVLRRQARRRARPPADHLVQGRARGRRSTASAPSCAGAIMPSCRSPSASCRKPSSTIGSPRPRRAPRADDAKAKLLRRRVGASL